MELANGSGKVTVAATLEREGDLENVKLRNLDYSRWDTKGRGGVDDLTALTHLHEPAILDVLVRGGCASVKSLHSCVTALRLPDRSPCATLTMQSTRVSARFCWPSIHTAAARAFTRGRCSRSTTRRCVGACGLCATQLACIARSASWRASTHAPRFPPAAPLSLSAGPAQVAGDRRGAAAAARVRDR